MIQRRALFRIRAASGPSCVVHTEYAYFVSVSIQRCLLALPERGPMHGYQLKTAFEESNGEPWPLRQVDDPLVFGSERTRRERTAGLRSTRTVTGSSTSRSR